MATATLDPHPTFNMGRVINRMAATIGRNLVPFALLASAPSLALGALVLAVTPLSDGKGGFSPNVGPTVLFALLGAAGAAGLLWVFLTYMLQAAIVHGTVLDLNGRRASTADMVRTGFGQALPILGLALLQSIGIGFGFLLLIVPGFILLTAWSVIIPVRVVEHMPVFDCFSRSSDLTRGHRWAILGLYIVYAFVSGIIQAATSTIAGIGGSDTAVASVLSIVMMVVQTIATSILLSVGIASLYYELRWIKEGTDPEQLAAVFD
jgi:hypothetical protein